MVIGINSTFTKQQFAVQQQIDLLKTNPPLVSAEEKAHLANKLPEPTLKDVFSGNLQLQTEKYDWGFGRPYFYKESVSLLSASGLSLLSAPALVAKTVYNFVIGLKNFIFRKEGAFTPFVSSGANLIKATKFVVVGAVLGVSKAALAVIHDTFKALRYWARPLNGALLGVDIQHDFFEEGTVELKGISHQYNRGSLAVPQACQILPKVNQLMSQKQAGMPTIFSQDWHPLDHGSFALNHGENDGIVPNKKLDDIDQVLWPVHCVQNSKGAAFVHGLDKKPDLVIQKGGNKRVDSYSAFLENDQVRETKLDEHLKAMGIKTLFVFGLAYDYCVGFTALDARKKGYEVILVEDATKGIAEASTQAMRNSLIAAGVKMMNADEARAQYPAFFVS